MQHWSFSGPFGQYDPEQLQRGFKIYREVCSTCHSLKLLSFRNLADPGGPGFTEAQAAAIAATFQVTDGPNDQGQMFQRPGKISDYFPPPFANDQAARAAFGGGLPPDMSDLAKARTYDEGFPWFIIDAFTMYQEQGPDYIHAIINGYSNPPADLPCLPGPTTTSTSPATPSRCRRRCTMVRSNTPTAPRKRSTNTDATSPPF